MSSGYLLPFPKGTKVWCTQGNNNTAPGASHAPGSKAAFAFDFSLAPGDADEGELIIAATGGIVAGIREDTPDDVTGSAGRGRGNYILIAHTDGTCDIYMHLKYASISEFDLTIGSQVVRGQPIARLGKTGYCFGAHLHFQRQGCGSCTIPCNKNYFQQSVPMTFDDVPGDGVPKAGLSYISQNELGGQPLTLEEALEEVTAQRHNALLLPARAFLAVAQQTGLGAPLSGLAQLVGPNGRPYHVQVFENDTLYLLAIPPIEQANVGRMNALLAADPNDPLGRLLWAHTYSNAGVTFQAQWASHLFALQQTASTPLGAPMGGGVTNGVHTNFIDGKRYEAEVYTRDTIYWIAGIWGEIYRMSQAQQSHALAFWLQEITTARHQAVLEPPRALLTFAGQAGLGAPLSVARRVTDPAGRAHHVQVFEGDTLYLPADFPATAANVRRMSPLLLADPNDAWGLRLWEHTYANVGVTFHPYWASHQFVLRQLGNDPLGAPLGGGSMNGVHTRTVDGARYEIEVYARDTIYWVPPNWGTILRKSDL